MADAVVVPLVVFATYVVIADISYLAQFANRAIGGNVDGNFLGSSTFTWMLSFSSTIRVVPRV